MKLDEVSDIYDRNARYMNVIMNYYMNYIIYTN